MGSWGSYFGSNSMIFEISIILYRLDAKAVIIGYADSSNKY